MLFLRARTTDWSGGLVEPPLTFRQRVAVFRLLDTEAAYVPGDVRAPPELHTPRYDWAEFLSSLRRLAFNT
ncbi:MAG: hypothetical protein LC733_10170 [Actinobacteria bacterium]|nr:hypothetical protein [Actinomycetota bacterium]